MAKFYSKYYGQVITGPFKALSNLDKRSWRLVEPKPKESGKWVTVKGALFSYQVKAK